ncbi:rust resistance kinase Lr10-like [Henckelia pumila]|uniref:rust resistance kinase Lr10-like n=1 Tax=Henckelia pumila TaxID=405737 RepID=UPI003C6DF932
MYSPPFYYTEITSYMFSPPPSDNSGEVKAVGVVVTFMVLAVIVAISLYCAKKMKRGIVSEIQAAIVPPPPINHVIQVWEVDAPTMEKFFRELAEEKPVRFTAQQLCSFTSNYSIVLGSGGFGKVYKGEFPNGVKIAVKVLNSGGPNKSIERWDYWEDSSHTLGICLATIKNWNGGSCKKSQLERLKGSRIYTKNVSRGSFIMTSSLETCFLMGISPKVADFGLAKLCNREDTHVTITGYRGTPGYLAPEFMLKNFPITYKCDVYSFGILPFEIVGRRKNTRVGDSGERMDWFPKHVWEEYEKGELLALLEKSGIQEKDMTRAEKTAMVALWCVQDSPEVRPPMSGVVKMLEGGVEIMPPPKPFHYLFSVGSTNVLKPPMDSGSGSGFTSSEGTNSYWYKDTTPIMAKYEITFASS